MTRSQTEATHRAAQAARNAVAGSLASRVRSHNDAADAAELAVVGALTDYFDGLFRPGVPWKCGYHPPGHEVNYQCPGTHTPRWPKCDYGSGRTPTYEQERP